jgi:hypothetical protein
MLFSSGRLYVWAESPALFVSQSKLFADVRGQCISQYSILTYCNFCYFYRNKNSIRSITLLEAVIKMKVTCVNQYI